MELNLRDEQQLVEIWLTKAEKKDQELRAGLKDIYDMYKKKRYLVTVYESGDKGLYENVRDLLVYNKRRTAEREVQREKKQRAAAPER